MGSDKLQGKRQSITAILVQVLCIRKSRLLRLVDQTQHVMPLL
jgi:hypothetical protein